MKKYIGISLALATLFTSCRKYVEIDQVGTRTLKYTTDYRYLLNNNNTFEGAWGYPILSGDDVEITDVTRTNAFNDIWNNVYTWGETYLSESQGDQDWDKFYSVIYNSNEVIAGVMTSEDGTDAAKRQLYAEALVHRANAYHCLVNIYGPQYDSATAATDLGVPLLLTPNLYTSLTRASVAKVYEQLISDLQFAIPYLPALPDYNVRPAKVSAYALLSRAYLNLRQFTKAGLYADSALQLQSGLLDLRTYVGNTTAIPLRLNDPEIIFSKLVSGNYTGVSLNTNLLNLLGTSDLRYTLFTAPGTSFSGQFSGSFTGRAYYRYRYTNEGIYVGPSVPEMMLNKAECAARAGDAATAIDLLNALRIKRFKTADYVAYTATTATDALAKTIDERKRELFGRGLRWFDQKRLNKDSAFAVTVTRIFKGNTYTLTPNSNRYIYPIGSKYILLNPEIQQSPR